MASKKAQQPLTSRPSQPAQTIEIEELDESNNITATYIKSPALDRPDFYDGVGVERVDVHVAKRATSYSKVLIDAFLPVGFPDSVTDDYLEYQIYDSLQAFSSSIAGMLSSRAVLEGIGVGSTHTTPTAALLLSILQSSLGRLATIAFASQLSSSLEPECKAYRFLADIFNDLSILLDCFSPALPTYGRVTALCGASVLRALCGVAAGSAKASLSAHFARNGNVAELAAKDSSQETVISLMGMLAGSVLIPYITTTTSTWLSLLLLISIHLYTNYRAVRAVCLPSLNCQRANLAFSSLLPSFLDLNQRPWKELKLQILEPDEVSVNERIFEVPSVLRFCGGAALGTCRLGVPMSSILESLPNSVRSAKTGTFFTSQNEVSALLKACGDVEYLLWYDLGRRRVLVAFKEAVDGGAKGHRVWLKAWFHALLFVWAWESGDAEALKGEVGGEEERQRSWRLLEDSTAFVKRRWGDIERQLEEAGWDIDVEALLMSGKGKVRVKSW